MYSIQFVGGPMHGQEIPGPEDLPARAQAGHALSVAHQVHGVQVGTVRYSLGLVPEPNSRVAVSTMDQGVIWVLAFVLGMDEAVKQGLLRMARKIRETKEVAP